MTGLLALAPQHTMRHAPSVVHAVLTLALEAIGDGREIYDLNMALGVTNDAEHGIRTIRHVMTYQPIDSIVCFGATYRSVGLDDKSELYKPVSIRFRQQLTAVNVVRLPPVLSGIWEAQETVDQSVEAVKVLLAPRPEILDLVQPGTALAYEWRDLN